jgi:hypothetical protein
MVVLNVLAEGEYGTGAARFVAGTGPAPKLRSLNRSLMSHALF